MLQTVDFCGLELTKMLIGANPFGGWSHQTKEVSDAMRDFHTEEVILDTWDRAYAAGINAFVTNTCCDKLFDASAKYVASGKPMKWLAQVEFHYWDEGIDYRGALDRSAAAGASGLFMQGEILGRLMNEGNVKLVRDFVEYARTKGVPVGIAGHNPEDHYQIDRLDLVDFHVIPLFYCKNDDFRIEDMFEATRLIRYLRKPCIAYKVLGAGRLEPRMGFSFALRNIKPNDVILVGMSRHADDDQVEKDVALMDELLKKMPLARP